MKIGVLQPMIARQKVHQGPGQVIAHEGIEWSLIRIDALGLAGSGITHERLRATRHENRHRSGPAVPGNDRLLWKTITLSPALPINVPRRG